MKKSKLRKIIKEEIKLLKEKKDFLRLPRKVIDSEVFDVNNMMNAMANWLMNDNDFKPEDLKKIVNKLVKIKDKAKLFKGDEIPDEKYRK